MKNPIISVIVPCYKQAQYLGEALNSILNQTFKDWECIIVDDGSPDNTREISEIWIKKDSRFSYIHKENGGLSSARNFGINAAVGEYIVVLDSDDYFESDFCEKAIKIKKSNESYYKIICCYTIRFNNEGSLNVFKPLGGNIKNFLFHNCAIGNSLFSKNDWEDVGGYDENMKQGYEDWEFYIRLLQNSGIAFVIEEPLFNYRQKKSSMRIDANKIKYELWEYIFTKHQALYMANYGDLLGFLIEKLKREEKEKIKNRNRLEFLIGKRILAPVRFFKVKIKMNPKITILLATYNRAHLIEETLRSIQDQTYAHFECLITDDRSTDNTPETVRTFCEDDKRFLYFKKPDNYLQGLSATRNFGLDLAEKRQAMYIQFFDDDDIMHPQKLELQITPFFKDNTLDLTICQYRKFWKKKVIEFDLNKANDGFCNIETTDLLKSFYLHKLNLNSLGPIWRFQKIKNYRFNENLYYTEERDFYLRIFLNEHIKYCSINYVLFWYRKHKKAITSGLYIDKNLKDKSHQLFQDTFLNEILKNRKMPFFLIKSYVGISVKHKNIKYSNLLNKYLLNNLFSDYRNIFLLIYLKLKFY